MAEGLHFPSFETSSETSADETKSKEKSKKKKSPETVAAPPEKPKAEEAKKETVAEHSKAVWRKLLGEDKPDEDPEKGADKPDESESSEEVSDETSAEDHAETAESAAEAGLAELSPEENQEVDERLRQAGIERLQAEVAATDDEAEIVAAEAAINMLKNLPEGGLAIEAADEESDGAEIAPAQTMPAPEDEPLPFSEEGDVPLMPPRPPSGGGRGSGRSGGWVPSSQLPLSGRPNTIAGPPERADRDPRMISTADAAIYERRAAGRGLLVGGIVGYLIGRRRGRIKTEKRLNAVIDKLEQQVEAKQLHIDRRIEAARQKARQEYWAGKAPRPALESRQAELQGRQGFETTTPRADRAERPEAARREQPERVRDPRELNDEEILKRSETIKVGATNLRQVFEAKLITKNGLRRLVAEAEQGGDVRRGLAREFLAKELSYERDPHFRDLPDDVVVRGGAAPAAASTSAAAGEPTAAGTSAAAPYAARSQPPNEPKRAKSPQISTGLLAVLTVLALGLAAVAVLLSLLR